MMRNHINVINIFNTINTFNILNKIVYLHVSYLQTSIVYLKGVGTARAEMLQKELGIFTLSDLLFHFPYRHIDRSQVYRIADISPDLPYIQLKGKITQFRTVGAKKAQRLVANLSDGTGNMELVW